MARSITVDEYLALESTSTTKHEYVSGAVVAMAGVSPRHNVIALNVAAALRDGLRASPCQVFGSDQRVKLEMTKTYVYPDVTALCAEPAFGDDRPASLLNPRLVVEVLSRSTEDYDRGAKLAHYRRTPSVREVVLVEPNEPRVEVYRRLDGGRWLITDVTGGVLELESVGLTVSLDELYAKTADLPLDD